MPKILHFFIPAIGYFIMGQFGLLLSIPPGFASAVWPASGLALTCLLRLNLLPATLGIGLGSFAVNLGIVSNGYSDFTNAFSFVPFAIAIGAMLQAQVGLFLFKLATHEDIHLTSPRNIFQFTFLVAPISCLIAASIAVTSLYSSNILAAENVLFNWATWWVGDTIGVLLFTPLLLTLFSKENLSRERRMQVILPSLVIFTGVILLFLNSVESQRNAIMKSINDESTRFLQTLEKNLSISKNKLYAYSAFHHGSDNISIDEFYAFSKTLLASDLVFSGVGWTEIVPHSERAKYIQAMRNYGYRDYQFTERSKNGNLVSASEQAHYYPVLYIYPTETNEAAFGFNLGSNPNRLDTLLKAKSEFTPIATPPIILAQEKENKKAVIIYVPIYDTPAIYAFGRIKKAPEDFKGFVSGVMRLNILVNPVLKKAHNLNYDFSIIDITDSKNPLPLLTASKEPLSQFPPVDRTFTFGKRTYNFSFYATNNYQFSSKDWLSWSILTVGLLLTAMLQGFILIITGITDNIRREVKLKTENLLQAKKTAEKANQAKSSFLANMNHELRTPLNAIIGIITLSLKSPLSERQHDYINKAKLASETLLSLINQTLDLSKIEAEKLEIEKSEFNLINLLLKVHSIFSMQAASKGIDFHIIPPEKIPRICIGDPLRIEQVILNICSNAIKFTTSGSVDIIINIADRKDDVIHLEITISDTGIGIKPEEQKYLFDSFKQADSSTTRQYGGTGLGLAISKKLAVLMGGDIKLSSELNQGSRFTIYFPLGYIADAGDQNRVDVVTMFTSLENTHRNKPTESQEGISDSFSSDDLASDNSLHNHSPHNYSPHNTAPNDDTQDYLPLKDVTVLLVEDVKMNQLVASGLLEDLGAKVNIADNGEIALSMLEQSADYSIILMDIHMPVLDGYDTTKKIRADERFKHLPIVAMTANVSTDDINKCLEAGMNDHIGKPIDDVDLLSKVLKHKR